MNKGNKTVECQKSFDDVKINSLLGDYIPVEQIPNSEKGGTANIANIFGNDNFVVQDSKIKGL